MKTSDFEGFTVACRPAAEKCWGVEEGVVFFFTEEEAFAKCKELIERDGPHWNVYKTIMQISGLVVQGIR